tara:strand:- start:187 stop:453 length:267 start_codon:yes stop_codon:yes gene_type:complete
MSKMEPRMIMLIKCVMDNRDLILNDNTGIEPEIRLYQMDALSAIRRYHGMMDDPMPNDRAYLSILGSLQEIINDSYDKKVEQLEAQTQ